MHWGGGFVFKETGIKVSGGLALRLANPLITSVDHGSVLSSRSLTTYRKRICGGAVKQICRWAAWSLGCKKMSN